MPTSILDIDIDTAKFDRFTSAFAKYQTALGKMGGMWGAAGKEAGKQHEFVTKMLAGMLAQQEAMRGVSREGAAFSRSVSSSTLSMTKLVRETHQIARNIASATLDLAKWTGVGALLGGAGGIFSLWGISRLAGDAAGALRSSRGLGVTSAEQQAFGINYQRAVDPGSLLSNIADAKSDYQKKWAFGALGIQNADQMDPAQLAVQLTERARQMYLHSDRSVQYAQNHGMTQFFSMDDLRRLGLMSEGEMEGMKGGFKSDAGILATDPTVMIKWQNFTTQLDRAGATIENTFIKGLVPLEPALEQFSKGMSDAIRTLMDNPHLKEWITELGGALKTAADYLGSDDFIKKMQSFGIGLGQLSDKIGSVLGWFGVTGSSGGSSGDGRRDRDSYITPGATSDADMPTSYYPRPGYKNPMTGLPWFQAVDPLGDTGGTLAPLRRGIARARLFDQHGIDEMGRPKSEVLKNLEKVWNLPTGVLDQIWSAESGRGANPGLSRAGALGDMQFMPATAKAYGISDRTNFDQEAQGAAHLMQDLLRQFHGDIREAVAAYNYRPDKVTDAVRQYGNAWLSHLPKETQDYVNHVTGGMTITVNNNTSANIVISSSQLPG